MAAKRIKKEIADLSKENLGAITLIPNESNIFSWRATLPGPSGSPYEGGVFEVDIRVPEDYPFSPPHLQFLTKLYHCNVASSGAICLDLLKTTWSPALSLYKVILSLSSLLTDPNPSDPLVPAIAQEYKRDRKRHDQTAREWVKIYATPKPQPIEVSTMSTSATRHSQPSPSSRVVAPSRRATPSSVVPPPSIIGTRRPNPFTTTNGSNPSPQTPIDLANDSDQDIGNASDIEVLGDNTANTSTNWFKTTDSSGQSAYLKSIIAPAFEFKRWTGPHGQRNEVVNRYILIDEEETENTLRKQEPTRTVNRPGNPVMRWDANVLPTNEACEDRHAVDLVPCEGFKHLSYLLAKDVRCMEMVRWIWSSSPTSMGMPDQPRRLYANNKETIFNFLAIDADILNTPLELIRSPASRRDRNSVLPFRPTDIQLAEVEPVGSCALTAVVDVAGDKLYVANLGDSRAVAGWWNPQTGKWTCDMLSNDHTGNNPEETARVRSGSSPEKHDNAMSKDGSGLRVLEKSGYEELTLVSDAMQTTIVKSQKERRSPPYLNAEPRVIWRDLHPVNKEELKFLIVASDGRDFSCLIEGQCKETTSPVWDRLTSEEAALLISAHLVHPNHPDVTKSVLPIIFPQFPPSRPRLYPAPKFPGGDKKLCRQMLSIKGARTRDMKDDITAIVMFFGDEDGNRSRGQDS
ncbi:MAG: hypothetical protein TREMPRED_003530 [Tremellales sp. Tagirdzhanova-0007]|nr:MAG: hypothetical protein TREMPRED_003530 [Tremellales sp. Tagirdzhanova-0007]